MRSPRFLAISAAWRVGFIGPVGPFHSHGTRSGRRYQISFTRHFACEHGVMDVHSAVVRTTETMPILFEHGGIPSASVLEHKEAPRRDLDARSVSSAGFSDLRFNDREVPGGIVELWHVVVVMK